MELFKMKVSSMKHFLLAFAPAILFSSLSLAALTAPPEWNCRQVDRFGQSAKHECAHPVSRKQFQIYELYGSRTDAALAQGYLAAEEFVTGTFPGLKTTIDRTLDTGNAAKTSFSKSIFQCYARRIKTSLNPEMKAMTRAFAEGIAKKYPGSNHADNAMTMLASYEISNVVTGFKQIFEDSSVEGFAELLGACGLARPLLSLGEISSALSRAEGLKMGCSGYAIPSTMSSEGTLLHGRNLDGGFVEFFNQFPSLYYVAETGKYKFMASAPAGSLVSGSVSGMNEKGISVSLHQLSTKHYISHHVNGQGSSAPYLQHRVLAEAASIDEAYQILSQSQRYGAWTLFISDAKTNESASIEFTGTKIQMARRTRGQPMSQTNHYLGSQMQDQYFTYSLAKQIESETRMLTLEQDFRRIPSFNLQEGIELLNGHKDPWSSQISFGRTTAKAYTLMTTIALPGHQQFWFTTGDARPANLGNFVGFQADWNRDSLSIVGTAKSLQFSGSPSWIRSMTSYVDAYVATLTKQNAKAVSLLDQAFSLAQREGIFEKHYLFMKGRMLEEMGGAAGSFSVWQQLLDDAERTAVEDSYALRVRLHWLNAAQLAGHRVANEARFSQVYSNALYNLQELEARYPRHGEIRKMKKTLASIWQGGAAEFGAPEFITIE